MNEPYKIEDTFIVHMGNTFNLIGISTNEIVVVLAIRLQEAQFLFRCHIFEKATKPLHCTATPPLPLSSLPHLCRPPPSRSSPTYMASPLINRLLSAYQSSRRRNQSYFISFISSPNTNWFPLLVVVCMLCAFPPTHTLTHTRHLLHAA